MIGTRTQFRDWLLTQGLTYSKYAKLPPEKKAELQQVYRKRGDT